MKKKNKKRWICIYLTQKKQKKQKNLLELNMLSLDTLGLHLTEFTTITNRSLCAIMKAIKGSTAMFS